MSAAPVLTVESVRGLPAETKRQLLAMLARDLLPTSGASLSVSDAAGEVVVYAVPVDARARAERALRAASPVYLAELQRRAATPEDSMSQEEALKLARPATEATR